jgi:hypothetical protein
LRARGRGRARGSTARSWVRAHGLACGRRRGSGRGNRRRGRGRGHVWWYRYSHGPRRARIRLLSTSPDGTNCQRGCVHSCGILAGRRSSGASGFPCAAAGQGRDWCPAAANLLCWPSPYNTPPAPPQARAAWSCWPRRTGRRG